MRSILLLLLTVFYFSANAQNNYNCFNQSNLKANWEYLGPVNNKEELKHQRFGNISSINVNPKNENEIFVGSPTGALMHTINKGKSWTVLTDNTDLPIIGVNGIIVDYSKKPYHILIATGSENFWYDTPDFGIFKSTDGGKTWLRKKASNNKDLFSPVYYNFIQKGENIFCRSKTSIIQSTDFGEHWEIILDRERKFSGFPLKEREIKHFHYEPTKKIMYFSTKKGNEDARLFALRLSDKSITELTPELHSTLKTQKKTNGLEAIQIHPLGDNKLLFGANHYNSTEVYFYEYDIEKSKIIEYEIPNAGNLIHASLYWYYGIYINNVNSNIRYIGGAFLYKSTDGGQTYNRLFGYSLGDNNIPHADIRSMLITKHSADGKSDHIYLGTDGGLSFSKDGGKTFKNLNGSELQLTQFYGLGSSQFSGIISAGSQDNSVISYIPKTKKWLYNVRGDGYDVAYAKHKPGLAYGQYNSRSVGISTNDLVPFSQNSHLRGHDNSCNRKTMLSHTNGDVYFAGQSLFHKKKGERKWSEYKTPLPHHAIAFDVSETNPEIIYMSGLWRDLVKTTDGGKTWKVMNDFLKINGFSFATRIQSICISPYNENKIWLGLGHQGGYTDLCATTTRIVESNDGGLTWKNITDGLPLFSVHDIKFYEGSYESLFMATDQGVYFRRGTGYKWQRFSDKLPKTLIGELNINYCRGKLIAATYGRGLWETDLPPIQDKNPLIVKGKKILSAPDGEAIVWTRDVVLRKRAKLTIDCPIYIRKGGKIKTKRKNQIIFTGKGKIINGCDEEWSGVQCK